MRLREFTVYLDVDLHERLKAEGLRSGLKLAEIVRSAVVAALNGKRKVSYKQARSLGVRDRLDLARKYVEVVLDAKTPPRQGRRWKRCVYLFRSARGRYHCMQKPPKQVYPKCFHGCAAYYPATRRRGGRSGGGSVTKM